jgi:Protein of unknown function (DUF1569)
MTVAAAPIVVDTGKVQGRRILHFDSLDQVLAEVDRLAAAERAGQLRRLGNWTLGQTLGHLATWAEFAYTGVPLKPPFFIRWILRFQKKKFLVGPMPAGVKIPNVEGGTLGREPLSLDEGVRRYKNVLRRLKVEAPTLPSPILGKMTHDESIALTMRHAELHLGFFVPE